MKVLVSYGYGAGFSTWTTANPCDRGLIELVEAEKWDKAEEYCEDKWPNEYWGGLRDCVVEEVEAGELFQIREYDGNESLVTFNVLNWRVAV